MERNDLLVLKTQLSEREEVRKEENSNLAKQLENKKIEMKENQKGFEAQLHALKEQCEKAREERDTKIRQLELDNADREQKNTRLEKDLSVAKTELKKLEVRIKEEYERFESEKHSLI